MDLQVKFYLKNPTTHFYHHEYRGGDFYFCKVPEKQSVSVKTFRVRLTLILLFLRLLYCWWNPGQVFGQQFFYPDPHQMLIGFTLGRDPSSIQYS